MPSGQVFINYRHEDSEGYVGRIYDRLVQRFPGRIFRDVTGLRPGENFVDALEREGRNCGVLLSVIGRHWLTITGRLGGRRLDDPNDILRQEIVHALQRNILVIPVLVGGAQPPKAEELPDDIMLLGSLHALPITEIDFEPDIERLIRRLEQALGEPCAEEKPSRPSGQNELNELLSRARSAIARQDWDAAVPALQSVLVLNPSDSEAASQLQFAVRQKELANLFARGQAFYERKEYAAALSCFQQVRAKGGNYNDVDSLITGIQLGSNSGGRSKPRRLRWIIAGALAVVVILFVVAVVNQDESKKPPTIGNESNTSTSPVSNSSTPTEADVATDTPSRTVSTSPLGSNSAQGEAWLRETASAVAAVRSWRDHIKNILSSAPQSMDAAQSMAQQLLSALDSYDQQLSNLSELLGRGEQENLITTERDRIQAQAIGQACDLLKEQSAKLRYEAQLLLQYNPYLVAPQVLQAELMPIDDQIRALDVRAAQVLAGAGIQ